MLGDSVELVDDGYYVADGTDCGGRRDLDGGEYGRSGKDRDHAHH